MRYNVLNYTTRKRIDFTFENPFTGDIGEAFERFHSIYEPEMIVTHPERKPRLTPAKDRTCRFCIKAYPEVTFRKIAHVFPQLMGNKNIIHDCECDACNETFGHYEDSLSKFLGMTRTTDFIKGQAGIPSFKSADGKFTNRYGTGKDGKHLIKLTGHADQIKPVDNGIELTATKQPYVPLDVMKCLYKIGYSIVDPIDLPHFNPTRKIITSTTLDGLLKNFAGVVRHTFPFPAQSPMIVRYKKKANLSDLKHPSTVISLHFSKYSYEFFLIDNRDDFMFAQGEPFDFIFAPPPFPGNQDELIIERIDLSETQKKEGEVDAVTFMIDLEKENE